jgi:hypothetical protein
VGKFLDPYLVLIFIFCWIAISILVSNLSGWARLARHYRTDAAFEGVRFHFQSARLRLGKNYGGCLTMGVNRRGLYLAVWLLFRIGHPPLFIPWCDVTMTERKKFFVQQVVFRCARCPTISCIISKRLADRIAEARGETGIASYLDGVTFFPNALPAF